MLNAKVQCAKRLSKYSMFGEGEGIFAQVRILTNHNKDQCPLHRHDQNQNCTLVFQTQSEVICPTAKAELKAKKEKNRGVATAQSKSTPLWQDLKRAVQMNACKLQLTKARSELKLLHSDARD